MMGGMSVLEAAVRANRIVVEVPRTGVEDWVVAAELLLQEGLGAWAFPVELVHLLPEVLALHGHRARVGVCGVTDAEGVRTAVAAGAHFVLAPVSGGDLRAGAGEVPLLTGGLTPQEVADVLRTGADTALVAPADALGAAYARSLPPLFPAASLVPWGRLERYQCDMWFQAGAAAAVVSEVILRPEDGAGANAPDEVARRAASFRPLNVN